MEFHGAAAFSVYDHRLQARGDCRRDRRVSGGALTIVLTLKDRAAFTQRWLAYAATALPYRILVADGGCDQTVAAAVAESKSRGLDIEYARYPYRSEERRVGKG